MKHSPQSGSLHGSKRSPKRSPQHSPEIPPLLLAFLQNQQEITKIKVPAGVTIAQSGEHCQNLVIVLSGRVKVYQPAVSGRSLTLYYIRDNESCILTASCILNTMPFPAYAETITEVQGLSVPSDKVQEWLETEPLWQQYVFNLLSKRMAGLIELVNALAFQDLDKRLADWLLGQSLISDEIKVTHQFIADELASSREVMSRLLKEFENEGLIQLGRGSIRILNPDTLRIY